MEENVVVEFNGLFFDFFVDGNGQTGITVSDQSPNNDEGAWNDIYCKKVKEHLNVYVANENVRED